MSWSEPFGSVAQPQEGRVNKDVSEETRGSWVTMHGPPVGSKPLREEATDRLSRLMQIQWWISHGVNSQQPPPTSIYKVVEIMVWEVYQCGRFYYMHGSLRPFCCVMCVYLVWPTRQYRLYQMNPSISPFSSPHSSSVLWCIFLRLPWRP